MFETAVVVVLGLIAGLLGMMIALYGGPMRDDLAVHEKLQEWAGVAVTVLSRFFSR